MYIYGNKLLLLLLLLLNIYFVDADQFREEVGCWWPLESCYQHINLRRGCINLALMSANGWCNIQALWAQ